MGLGDILGKSLVKSTVLTEYQADTKQMRFELNRMSKEEKKRHRALIQQTEEQNYTIDKANKKAIEGDEARRASLAKVGVGLAAAAVAYKVLSDANEVYRHNSKLASATVGVDLDGLRKATRGLVDDTRILEFAAASMNGKFQLTQQEMEGALSGVLAFRKEGNELEKTLDNVQKALTEGTVEPLKELGHVIKGVENDTREGLNAALKDLTDTARNAGPDLSVPGDSMSQSSVRMANSVDALQHSLGKLAVSLAPVTEAIAGLVEDMAELLSGANMFTGKGSKNSLFAQANAELARQASIKSSRARGVIETGYDPGGYEAPAAIVTPAVTISGTKKRGGRRRAAAKDASSRPELSNQFNPAQGLAHQAQEADDAITGMLAQWALLDEEKEKVLAAQAEVTAAAGAALDGKRNLLTSIFGAPSEIDAQTAALQGLASTFEGLTGAFGAGIDALITGSGSWADAVKGAAAEHLRGMAVEMGMQALRHGAYALGSLAFGDVAGASRHGIAAATFAAQATAAGVGANLLGAGQAQGGASPRTAGSAGVGSSQGSSAPSGDSKGTTIVNLIGNDFAGMPARQREANYRQMMRNSGISLDGDAIRNG